MCERSQVTGLRPKVVVEWLTLLLRILEVRVQISARRPSILNEVFHGFPQSLQLDATIFSTLN
jgi:hypothetical protein